MEGEGAESTCGQRKKANKATVSKKTKAKKQLLMDEVAEWLAQAFWAKPDDFGFVGMCCLWLPV